MLDLILEGLRVAILLLISMAGLFVAFLSVWAWVNFTYEAQVKIERWSKVASGAFGFLSFIIYIDMMWAAGQIIGSFIETIR
jgi:hypothetical protein